MSDSPNSGPGRPFWRSISFRLNALFVVMVSSLLAVSGALSYRQTSVRLEQETRATQESIRERLQISLQPAVWNLDVPALDLILAAELNESVRGIMVLDPKGKLVAQKGDLQRPVATTFGFPLTYVQSGIRQPIGQVAVAWSDESAIKTLHDQVWWRIADIVVLDLALVGVLWLSLRLLVFIRLDALRRALDFAAERNERAHEFPLPIERDDELGVVARGFNRIARRLGEDLDERRRAEMEIRAAYDDLKKTQGLLLQSEKLAALGRLVAGVAHELNTPIGNSLLSATTLAERTEAFAVQASAKELRRSTLDIYIAQSSEASGILVRNLEKAARLISSFKQVAADQTSSQRRGFALKEVVEEVLLAHRPMLRKFPIEIVTDVPEGIRLDSYPGPLGQVLGNLITNAVLHGYEDTSQGSVRLSARLENNNVVEIAVIDRGRGINEADLKKIFDPFFTTRLGRGGTGLGLSICHQIVTETLGGSIRVISRPGEGSTFSLRLPCVARRSEFVQEAA